MTDDIVDRLRLAAKPEEWASVWGLTVARCSMLRDAADEIERLREALERWEAVVNSVTQGHNKLGLNGYDIVDAELRVLRHGRELDAKEIERLRAQVAELLPFAWANAADDVRRASAPGNPFSGWGGGGPHD